MSTLTALQVAAAAYKGGFRGNAIVEAVAVSFAESSWNTESENPCCKGLWAIKLNVHAVSGFNWKDPVANAQSAHSIWSNAGGTFKKDWVATYGKARYQQALPQARVAAAQLQQTINTEGNKGVDKLLQGTRVDNPYQTGSGVPSVDSALQGFSAIIEFMNRLGTWISNPDNWTRVFKVVVGGVLIIVGTGIIAKDTVLNNLPVGKLAKIAKGVR